MSPLYSLVKYFGCLVAFRQVFKNFDKHQETATIARIQSSPHCSKWMVMLRRFVATCQAGLQPDLIKTLNESISFACVCKITAPSYIV